MKQKVVFIIATLLLFTGIYIPTASAQSFPGQTLLGADEIDQFVDPLPILDITGADNGWMRTIIAGEDQIVVNMEEFQSRVLPSTFYEDEDEGTWVWGYIEDGTDLSEPQETYIGPVVVATRGIPTEFKFVNNLGDAATTNVLSYKNSTDQSLHWANPDGEPMYIYNEEEEFWVGNPDHYTGAIPAAVHLHGAEDPAAIDGGPEAWFTSDGQHGAAFYSMDGNTDGNYCIYRYPNVQEAAPLWFHDHTLGATRLNVFSGLAGAYALIDPMLKLPAGLSATGLERSEPNPADDTLIPLVIQDRSFDTDGQLYFNAGPEDPYNPSVNPEHEYWVPEFFGNTIAVNGKVWPYQEVKAQRYRFFLINGSNSRTYVLTFEDTDGTDNEANPVMWQIATDQGYLDKPVEVQRLTVMPGERAEFIIDFAGIEAGTEIVLNNLGPDEPFGGGIPGVDYDSADPTTTGRVMQFRVVEGAVETDDSFDPSAAKATIRKGGDRIVRLVDAETGTLAKKVNPDLTRLLTLNEVAYDEETEINGVLYEGGPLEALVNNTKWNGMEPDPDNPNNHLGPRDDFTPDGIGNYLSEMPLEGATEVWEIVNTTADAHPIHTHLVQFQVLNRQSFDEEAYWEAYEDEFPGDEYIPGYGPPMDYAPSEASGGKYGGNPDIDPYLMGDIELPEPNEAGWKDTVFVPPGMVTRIVMRWAPTDFPVQPKGSAALRYDFIPNDSIPGNPDAIFDYVWHCHIIDHEDNEMMRPDAVIPNPLIPYFARSYVMGRDY